MLEALRSGLGFRIAVTFALFAAFCFTAPPAVMAFGHGVNTLHCLSQIDSSDHGLAHLKHGAKSDRHGDHTQLPLGKSPGCCGLYCLSALMPSGAPVLVALELPRAASPRLEPLFSGPIQELPERPPTTALPV